MNLGKLAKSVGAVLSKNSPAIFTGLGLGGFAATIVMTAKASPKVQDIHKRAEWDREDIQGSDHPSEQARKDALRDSYVEEAKVLAPICLPPIFVGLASVACILASDKIQADRKAAVMAAYSLSAETLGRYQEKVIEKLGDEVHRDILEETTKEMVRDKAPENLEPEKIVVPEGTVRVYDNVTGRYFFSSRDRILAAESEINKRLINEVRVPLQEFYYEMGLEERFTLGESMGWDVSNPYYDAGNLDIYFTPMLDDDKNPCLALNYHVMVFDRKV